MDHKNIFGHILTPFRPVFQMLLFPYFTCPGEPEIRRRPGAFRARL
ncbi:hypothetical protein C3B79_1830 [Aeromonas hydrophila]|nr:hypothetical protein C3B79_1830 [Aeromonas hydrophila]